MIETITETPIDKVKYFEGSMYVIDLVKHYNTLLRSQVLDCGA